MVLIHGNQGANKVLNERCREDTNKNKTKLSDAEINAFCGEPGDEMWKYSSHGHGYKYVSTKYRNWARLHKKQLEIKKKYQELGYEPNYNYEQLFEKLSKQDVADTIEAINEFYTPNDESSISTSKPKVSARTSTRFVGGRKSRRKRR